MGNWIPRWQNCKHSRSLTMTLLRTNNSTVKHICRMVGMYMREECECLPYLSRNLVPDLKAVALDGSKEATAQVSWASGKIEKNYLTERYCQLVQAVFLAAMYSPNSNQRMVKVLDSLGTKVALPLANAITDMQEQDRKLANSAENERAKFDDFQAKTPLEDLKVTGVGRDAELESEERLIQAHASIKRLETHSVEQSRTIEALRANNAVLEGKLAEEKLRLDNEDRTESEGEALKSLRVQYARDKDYIVELEGELESTKSTVESQRTQLERLKADTISKQDLRDELQLIRIERDELASKAKANNNLRKKIENLQNEEKRNQELRQQLEANNESLQQYDELEKTCEALRTAHAESQRTIANQEIEIFHIKETKKRLEQELETITLDLKDVIDQGSKYEETIVDLQSRLNDVESEQAGNGLVAGSLDAEMAQKEFEDRLKTIKVLLRWQRGLTNNSKGATSNKPASNSEKHEDNVTILQKELKSLQERNSRTEAYYLEVANENRGLRNLIKAATGDEEIEYRIHDQITGKSLTDWLGSKAPFVKQNERLLEFRQAAEEYKRKYFDLAKELKETQKFLSKTAGSNEDVSDRHSSQKGESNEVKRLSGVDLESQSEVWSTFNDRSATSSPSSTCSVFPPTYHSHLNGHCSSVRNGEDATFGLSGALPSPRPAYVGARSLQTGIKPKISAFQNMSQITASSQAVSPLLLPSSSSSSLTKKATSRTSFRVSLMNVFANGKH